MLGKWGVQLLGRHLVASRSYSYSSKRAQSKTAAKIAEIEEKKETDVPMEEGSINGNFLEREVGSVYRKWSAALAKHPELRNTKRKDVLNAVATLKSLNFTADDIVSKPMILYSSGNTLMNRHSVLLECGVEKLTIGILFKYLTFMNRTIVMLKAYGYMPMELDVRERLRSCFTDLELELPDNCARDNNITLKGMRQDLLNCYFRQRLDMNETDIIKLWKSYPRVRHKSFESVQNIIKVLMDDLQFNKERINKNAYLLHGDAMNVKRIIREIPLIGGHDIREIAYRRPKLLMSNYETLRKTLDHVKNFGINEDAIVRCLEVLTLGSDTVLERLRDLNEIEEFRVLGSNPRILRLVHYQNKARMRLEYLNQLKVRCASLHILSCGSDAFAKYAREGSDRTKGRDIVVFLSHILEKDEKDLQEKLSRHPNWCHIPVKHVKQCFDYLQEKKFKLLQIFENVHILFYPQKRIEEKYQLLQNPQFFEELNLNIKLRDLSNSQFLTLIIYLIESEFHFTGDGVWTEQHTQQVENFNNLLPDFPESLNKVYKYGVKPANSQRLEGANQQL